MKKLLYLALAAAILPFAFSACGDDEEDVIEQEKAVEENEEEEVVEEIEEARTYTVRDLHGLWYFKNDSFALWFICDTTFEETKGRNVVYYNYAPTWIYMTEQNGGKQEIFLPKWNTAEFIHSGDSGTILFKEFSTSTRYEFVDDPFWNLTPAIISSPATISYKFVTDSLLTIWVSECETTTELKSVGLKRTLKKRPWQHNMLILYVGWESDAIDYVEPKWD